MFSIGKSATAVNTYYMTPYVFEYNKLQAGNRGPNCRNTEKQMDNKGEF